MQLLRLALGSHGDLVSPNKLPADYPIYGSSASFLRYPATSALPLEADIRQARWHVQELPVAAVRVLSE